MPMVQAALYQLTLERKIGEYELPEGASLIACSNRESDRGVRAGVTFACRRGSTACSDVGRLFPKAGLRAFDDDVQAFQAVLGGNAHAVLASYPQPLEWAAAAPDLIFLPTTENLFRSDEAFGLRKGDPDGLNFFSNWILVNTKRAASSNRMYRAEFANYLGDWRMRPLDAIARRDVEDRFIRLTRDHGWVGANRAMALLRSVYRRPCVDIDGLRNPVDLWLAGGGEYHRPRRRKISTPAEVLPRWLAGIEAVVVTPAARDAFLFGLYTGMRINEVLPLRWERIDMAGPAFRVEETKTGEPLELPVTRQLTAILERRRTESEALTGDLRDWVFPSTLSASGHVANFPARERMVIGQRGTSRGSSLLRDRYVVNIRRRPRGISG